MAHYIVRYNDLRDQVTALRSIGKAVESCEDRLAPILASISNGDYRIAVRATGKHDLSQRVSLLETTASQIGQSLLAAEQKAYSAITGGKMSNFTGMLTAGAIVAAGVKPVAMQTLKPSVSRLWGGISNGAKNIWNKTQKVLSNPRVKSGLKIVGGIMSTIALSALLVTPAAPFAYVGLVYAGNSIISGIDGVASGRDVNYLKTGLEWTGGQVGKALGNEELGKKIGNITYNTGAVVAVATSFVGGVYGTAGDISKLAGIPEQATRLAAVNQAVSFGIIKTTGSFISKTIDIDEYIFDATGVETGKPIGWNTMGSLYDIYDDVDDILSLAKVFVN